MPHVPTVLGPVEVIGQGRYIPRIQRPTCDPTASPTTRSPASSCAPPRASWEAHSASAPSLDSAHCGLLSRYGSLSQQGQEESREGGRRAPGGANQGDGTDDGRASGNDRRDTSRPGPARMGPDPRPADRPGSRGPRQPGLSYLSAPSWLGHFGRRNAAASITPMSDQTGTTAPAPPADTQAPGFDTQHAHSARVYNYWLGGKDNFAADREAAEQAIAANPGIVTDVRANRAFLARAVRFLSADCGVRQFLDIGTGLPTASNTHEVAQS